MTVEDNKPRFNEYFSRLKVDDEDGSDFTDHWNSGELLCLASAVQRSGDKNWVSVSRAIKPYGEPKRPSDWYASKNCALQYSKLLKGVEDLKKKSLPRTERETSEELLVKNLTDKRLNELKYQNRLFLSVGSALQTQLDSLEHGELDEHLDDVIKQLDELEKADKEEYKEWLTKRESLNQVKRLNKCRAPISKGKAPTSRSLESRRKNSPNRDHSDHDSLQALVADGTIKIEVDSGEESPQLTKIKIKTEPDSFIIPRDDGRMCSPQISIPSSQPAPPTSPLLTSLLRNVASASPVTSMGISSTTSSPLKEISAEDLLLQSAKLLVPLPESSRKLDLSQPIFLSPTPTSAISPLLTSLLKSPTTATPVSPISTNVVAPTLPKEVEHMQALEPLKLPGNILEAEGATVPRMKEIVAVAGSHPIPATSPLLNSLLKSPNSSVSTAAVASTSPLQILQPKEATTPKSASPPQPFFNPTSALATAAAQQLAVATASLPQNHHFFQQPEPSNGRKSLLSSPLNSATLSAPTLSKLLEMPPSIPGKLPPLPVIEPHSSNLVSTDSASSSAPLFHTPPRNLNSPRGQAITPPRVVKQLFFEVQDASSDKPRFADVISYQKEVLKVSESPSSGGESQMIKSISHGSVVSQLKSIEAVTSDSKSCGTLIETKSNERILQVDQPKAIELISAELLNVDSALQMDPSKTMGRDSMESFPFDDLAFEDAESILRALSNSTGKEAIEAQLEASSKQQELNLSPTFTLGINKFEKLSSPIVETSPTSSKGVEAMEDDSMGNNKKFYKSRVTPKKRTSAEEDLIEKASENVIQTSPRLSAKRAIRTPTKLPFDFNLDGEPSESAVLAPSDQEENKNVPEPLETDPSLPKKARYEKPADVSKENSEEESNYVKRPGPGRRPKKLRGKVLKSTKTEEAKDQYEFSESTEESSVGYQAANTLCYMPRTKDEPHLEEPKSKPQDSEKKYLGVPQKIKQSSPGDNTSGKKALFASDEDQISDPLDIGEDSNIQQPPDEKVHNWRTSNEKQMESSETVVKGNLRRGTAADVSKLQPVKKTFNRSDKSKTSKKAKKQLKDATESDFEELATFSQDCEESSLQSTSQSDKGKSDTLISEMEVETNDSHVSSSIAAESDRQIDELDFSTPPSSARGDKRFGKQEWFHSPKSSEPVSQSSEDSEDYESDNSDNQSVSTNKSTSQSIEQPRMTRKERENPEYKAWKKSISIVWREISSHKYANVFLQKVTNDVAPGYLSIVNRPMDLMQIKKNIENGAIRTTFEFMRDMMLMFQNAIMYNSSDHDVYQMAVEMQKDVKNQILDFYATQVIIKEKGGEQTPTSSLRAARNKAGNKTPQSVPKVREDADRVKEA